MRHATYARQSAGCGGQSGLEPTETAMPRQTVGKSSAGGGHESAETRAAVTDGAVSFRQCARLPELPSFMGSTGDIFFFQRGAARALHGPAGQSSTDIMTQTSAGLVSLRNFPEGGIARIRCE